MPRRDEAVLGARFERSAEHYDLLYRDKDYSAEASFVLATLRRLKPGARSILELGCGTGRHALELARRGCRVSGVDRSARMLAKARARAAALPAASRPEFHLADVRRFDLERRFDAVIALFHVFGYLSGPAELRDALACARAHLRPGGALLFDCWYGPAVLAQFPKPRIRRAAERGRTIVRSSSIRWDREGSSVEVRHRFRVRPGRNGAADCFRETHRVRYWFRREIEAALRAAGFAPAGGAEWMTRRRLGRSTWNACFTAVASGRKKPARRASVAGRRLV